jgi:hypothetical protein
VPDGDKPVTTVADEVVCVVLTVIWQFEVLSDAATLMPDKKLMVDTEATTLPANTAVAVSNGTSTRNHAVPSLAIEQSVAAAGAGNEKNRFVATTVFGVFAWFLNVTVFVAPMLHAPVNVAMRNVFRCCGTGTASNVSGRSARLPVSTLRIVLTIRNAAASSKMTGRAMSSRRRVGEESVEVHLTMNATL